ncbi:hypothetical protein [Nonomuraea sp. NPDC049607]|uniref:hypothetical protein n=1 Tax=Nonomuraea sp. NPDC049607 TaxID=3154732 RepID=UPI003433321C
MTDAGSEPDRGTSGSVRHRDAIFPLLVIQPGAFHPYGTPGYVADMLSMGLRPVDLTRGAIDEITGWQVRMERGRVAELTRRGTAAWWRADATTGGVDVEWRKAAKARRQMVLLVLPPGRPAGEQDDITGQMLRACSEGVASGGVIPVRGTFF